MDLKRVIVHFPQHEPRSYVAKRHRDRVFRSLPHKAVSNVTRKFRSVLNGFSGEFDDLAIAHFRAHGASVSVNDVARKLNVPWGIDRIDGIAQDGNELTGEYLTPLYGENTTIYVLDVGIRTSHEQFHGRVGTGKDFIGDDPSADCDPHGTHVAGIAVGATLGVARGAKLVPIRVLDCNGVGPTDGIIEALDWMSEQPDALKVASLSLGQGRNSALESAVRQIVNVHNVVVVAAAGNDSGDACSVSPALLGGDGGEVITVGATTIADVAAYFSNSGSCVDVFAPGTDIKSAWIGSDTATGSISGTSMATPHVSGVAALLMSQRDGKGLSTKPSVIKSTIIAQSLKDIITDSPLVSGRNVPNRLVQVPPETFPPPAPPAPPSPPMSPPAPPAPPSPPNGRILSVQITADDAPEQTSWKLYRVDGKTLVQVSSENLEGVGKGQTRTWTVELQPGFYQWSILDGNFDGICCINGKGSYKLFLGDEVFATGGEFKELVSHSFLFDTVPSPSPPPSPESPPPAPPPPLPQYYEVPPDWQKYTAVGASVITGVAFLAAVARVWCFPSGNALVPFAEKPPIVHSNSGTNARTPSRDAPRSTTGFAQG